MNKLIHIILLCFGLVGISCNDWPNPNSTAPKWEYSSSRSLSNSERLAAKARYDSLMEVNLQQKWATNADIKTKTLFECLSLAQSLTNDTLLASVYIRLSGYYDDIAEYNLEIDILNKAFEKFDAIQNNSGCATSLNNMAWAYIQAYDYKKGIEQAHKGILYASRIPGDTLKYRVTSFLNATLALAYLEDNQADSALKYNNISYQMLPFVNRGKLNQYCWLNSTFGSIYAVKKDYQRSETSFKNVLAFKDSSSAADAIVFTISKYCHVLNLQGRYKECILLGRDGMAIAKKSELVRYQIDIADELRNAFEKLQKIDSAFVYSKTATQLRDKVFNTRKSIQLQSMSFNQDLKAKELAFEIEKAKAEEKFKREQMLRNSLLLGFVLVMFFAILFLYQRNKIRSGKIRSDELLLNILPEEVAEELKAKGSTSAKYYEQVTVMFTDFKNFTQIAERLSPQQLVSEMDTCFKAFDEIMETYGIEKIKTIGDSYMCAGGLPVANKTHALDVVNASLEIQAFILNRVAKSTALGQESFQIRIGIHTGPVVAGIVGSKKFAYDIWGDAVNTASRMESSGEVGKVNISGTTYELVKDQFTCTHRGKIQAKNKGELDMYYVEGRIGMS